MQDRDSIDRLATVWEGVPLWGVLPDSPASRAGLRYGDIVIAVGEVRVRSALACLEALGALGEERPHITFLRQGQLKRALLDVRGVAIELEDVVDEVLAAGMLNGP